MTTVCAIEHTPCETLGLIAGILKEQRILVERIRPFKEERIPAEMGRFAGLIVMGGPMSVQDQDRYPFLRQEIRLIEHALREGKPILGVCLGSQLLATALGAAVTRGPRKEIGWHPVTPTKTALTDPLWSGQTRAFVAYHWHGDAFTLPRGSVSLARSSLTTCQAFRHERSAYGILFHMEVTSAIINGMTRTFRTELSQAGVTRDEILGGATQHLSHLHRVGRSVFEGWARLVNA